MDERGRTERRNSLLGSKVVPLFDMRLRRFEVSIFKGVDNKNPVGWLHQVER